jgi:hypothetical protein
MSEMSSGMVASGQPLSREEEDQVAAAKARASASAAFDELHLNRVDRGFLADERGDLYEEVAGTAVSSSGRILIDPQAVDGFFLEDVFDSLGLPVFVKRAPKGGPRTLDDLRKQRDRERKARAKGEAERLKALEKTACSPVLLGELLGSGIPGSLREAGYMIERAGGKLGVKGEELVVELPSRSRPRGEVLGAARLIFGAREIVIEALRSKRGVDGLPDRPLRAGEL